LLPVNLYRFPLKTGKPAYTGSGVFIAYPSRAKTVLYFMDGSCGRSKTMIVYRRRTAVSFVILL